MQRALAASKQARDLIRFVNKANNGPTSSAAVLVETLPAILETALSHLLADFDYEARIDSHSAVAARLVAICTDQMHRTKKQEQRRKRTKSRSS
jgi:hypothetical protein